MPPNTAKIDRSTRWGNPYKVGSIAVHPITRRGIWVENAQVAVELFAAHLGTASAAKLIAAAQSELGGKNLACWCKAGEVCHGDVLLRLVNLDTRAHIAA